MEELFAPSFLVNTERRHAIPKDASVTMAYVPLQLTVEAYKSQEGLAKGTLFPQLDKPFKGRMVRQ